MSHPTSAIEPAGWYSDPESPGQQRYWDGQAWTQRTRTEAVAAAVPAEGNAIAPDEPAPEPRRPFAARYRHPGWGWFLTVFGGLELIGALGALASNPSPSLGIPTVVGAAFIVWGVYLLRGQGIKPKTGGARKAKSNPVMDEQYEEEVQAMRDGILATARSGAKADAERRVLELLEYAGRHRGNAGKIALGPFIQKLRAEGALSPRKLVGTVHSENYFSAAGRSGKLVAPLLTDSRKKRPIKVYEDLVVQGDDIYLIDSRTQAMVYLDGQEQVTKRLSLTGAAIGAALPGSSLLWAGLMAKNEKHDSRVAEFHVGSAGWSLKCLISPDGMSQPRQIAQRINSIADALAAAEPSPIALTNTTPESTLTDKMNELGGLREQGLLTDDEFTAAKAKLLGLN